ncbi:MAG: zinc-dependent metalloprotease [Actinomycetota bacterium]|nr:zinc-dependent metalloprotease [Actinomycetota bacterium]
MSDDLFARLLDLFNSPGPVNWKLAAEVGRGLAGEQEPIDPLLADEYRELVRIAQLHVEEASGLDLGSAPPASPVDRVSWVEANLRSFRYLAEPLAEKLSAGSHAAAGPLDAMLQPLAPALLGLQMGAMVGFLSHRVLGQFDVGLPAVEQRNLYLVVPNVEAFARDYQLDARQVRLWVALHEVTHQAEFAQGWVRPHFLQLIEEYVGGLELDPNTLSERMQTLSDPQDLDRLLRDPAGIAGFLSGPGQRRALETLQAFMAVMEGYGEFVMDRAAPRLLPDMPRMREAMHRRRAEPSQGEQILQRLLGLELKRQQYQLGARFCEEVERRWGGQALARLWEGPENLPSLAELEDPLGWAARVLVE